MSFATSVMAIRPKTYTLPQSKSDVMAMNAGGFSYYASVYPFINLIKSCGERFNPINGAVRTTDGWLTGIANGDSYSFGCILALNPYSGKAPPGNYVFKSTSTCTLSVTAGTGISNIVPGAGSCTFTIVDLGAGNWGSFQLRPTVTNPGGGAKNFTDGYVCLASEEASLLSGEIFKADYLNDMRRASSIRFMDWLGTNNNPFSTISEYGSQNLSKFTYALNNNGFGDPVPFGVCAELCKKLGCKFWLTIPPATKSRLWNYDATTDIFTSCNWQDFAQIEPHQFSNNERVMFNAGGTTSVIAPFAMNTIYFVKVLSSTTYQLALTSGGAAVPLSTSTNLDPISANFMRLGSLDGDLVGFSTSIANAIKATYPAVSFYAEDGNEGWNGAFTQYHWNSSAGSWLAQGNATSPNASLGYAYTCLSVWKGVEASVGTGNTVRVFSHQTASFSSGMWDYVDPGIYSPGQTISQILAVGVLTRSTYAIAPYVIANNGTIDRPNPTQIYTDNGNTETIPDSYWATCFTRGISPAVGWVTTSRDGARAKVASIPITCYEYNIDWFWQGSDVHGAAIATSMLTWLDGPGGLALFQAMQAAIITAPGVALVNQYFSSGGYASNNNQMIQWGLKGYSGLPDTPRSAYYQAL